MRKRWLALAALVWFAGCSPAPMDVVGDVARTIGAVDLRTIQYSGSGTIYALGQSPNPEAPWPRFHLSSYTRVIDYEQSAMQEDYARTQYEDPPHGGGNQPIFGERRSVLFVNGNRAWNVNPNGGLRPAPLTVADRQAQIWITPHGWVKAAQGENSSMETRSEGGRQLTAVSFTVHGFYEVTGYVNDQSFLERVETRLPNPAFGDMLVEVTYSDYQSFDGIQFPTRIQQSQGGHPTLDLTVNDVQPNVAVDLAVPEAIEQATSGGRVEAQQVAEGVWFLTGGSHHSVAVAFSDFVAVVEAPLNEERSLAVIDEVKRLVPGKPIRYLINTHHHVDHSGGLRTYVAEGATIVTHQINRAFYESMFEEPRVVSADKLSQNPRDAMFETVTDRHTLTDGSRTLEIYHIRDNGHNDGILMAYLPQERLLIEADVFTPLPADASPPANVSVYTQNFAENIRRLGLNVDRILPIHGRIVGMAELQKALGGAG